MWRSERPRTRSIFYYINYARKKWTLKTVTPRPIMHTKSSPYLPRCCSYFILSIRIKNNVLLCTIYSKTIYLSKILPPYSISFKNALLLKSIYFLRWWYYYNTSYIFSYVTRYSRLKHCCDWKTYAQTHFLNICPDMWLCTWKT